MANKFTYDKVAAERIVKFIEQRCTHVKGELAPANIKLEDWTKEILREIFGWMREDGTRKYRMAYIEVPRKNGKTTITAGVGLYMLLADDEKGAEVYSAAASREQANIAFEIASQMVEQDAKLESRCEVFRSAITVPKTNSRFKSLSKESKTKHGLNASCVIVDELHAHPDRELFDVLLTSTGSRRQPLVIVITTAGVKDETSIGWIMHEKARKQIEGIENDESFYAKIYGASDDDDPSDEKVWKKANPNLDISVKMDYLRDQWHRVESEPSFLNVFKRLHLDIWTGSYHAFISSIEWNACNIKLVKEKDMVGQECICALDLASTSDFNAFVCVFKEDETYHVLPYFWIPKDTIKNRPNSQQIQSWVDQKYITATPGNVSDYNYIRKKIGELSDKFTIQQVAFDRWNARQLAIDLEDDGLNMIEFIQGYKSFSPAMKELERLILKKQLNHGGHPVLTWMNDNLVYSQDPAGNIKPNKVKSADKIDGMVSLIMCIGRWIFHQPQTTTSMYETLDDEDLII